ncbi:MAG: response regulator [Myxococcaceae bacterium]
MKFLLVDDIEDNLVALEAVLRRPGLEVLMATSGAAALELLLTHEVALAILDVQMPEMNGFELAELMRGAERTKRVPIIFLTAGTRDQQRIFKGYETGAVDFLFKPLDPRVIKSKADVFYELYRQRQDLAEALALNELFIGILGHDLRNPLSAMVAGAQLLERDVTSPKALRNAGRVVSSGMRMSQMIDQLLDLTRARLGGGLGLARARETVNLGNLLLQSVEELRPVHPNRTVVVTNEGELSSAGDPGRLLQLFSNLVANALTHGSGDRVEISARGDERQIEIAVRNAGTVPPSLMPTLFDPFRARPERALASRSMGLGLGLFICRQIAIAHGGTVDVASDDGHTTFTVKLPKRVTPAHSKPGAPGAAPVLVVDDDAAIREALSQTLEDAGLPVTGVSTAADARAALGGEARPSVLVLRLGSPLYEGEQVMRALEDDRALSTVPVIAVMNDTRRAPQGVTALPRSFETQELLDAVNRARGI